MRRVWNLEWTTAGCTVMRSCEKLLMTANSGKKRLMDSPEFSFKLLNKGSVLPSIHLWFTVTLYYRDSFSIFDSVYHVVRVKLFWLVNKCRRVQGQQSHWWRHKTKQSAYPEMCTSIWSSTSSILVSSGGVSYLTLALANTQHRPRREP